MALQGRLTEEGSKPPRGALAEDLVNMSVGSEAGVFGGGLVDCDAVWEMEVCWPSRVGLRRRALNRREGLWLMTVVLNVVGKGGLLPVPLSGIADIGSILGWGMGLLI